MSFYSRENFKDKADCKIALLELIDKLGASTEGQVLNFLNFDLKKWLITGAAFLLPLITINMEQKPMESNWMSRPFFFVSSLIQDGLYGFSSGVKETTAEYLNLLKIKKENTELRRSNHEMSARLLEFAELDKENLRLRELLDFKQKTKMKLLAAQVIGRDLVPDHNTVKINKGLDQGVKEGQAVIALDGAVGYVFRPEKGSSHVMLLTDRYAVADALVSRTRAGGIVEGRGQRSLVMKYVERTVDVQTGDLVVTGGLDNIFPKGFPLARVANVEKKSTSISLKVELTPVIDPQVLEEVFVVSDAAFEDMQAIALNQTDALKTSEESKTENKDP